MTWITAFALTQLLEISSGLLIWKNAPLHRRVLGIFYASALTHLCVWFLFYPLYAQKHCSYVTYLIIAESYAYGCEIIWYKLIKAEHPIRLSCVTNTTSFLTGLLLHHFEVF